MSMQSRNPYEKISLDVTIEILQSNDPQWDCLTLSCISINLVQRQGRELSCITDNHLIQLAQAIIQNKTLRHVDINGIDPSRSLEWTAIGAKALGKSLKDH